MNTSRFQTFRSDNFGFGSPTTIIAIGILAVFVIGGGFFGYQYLQLQKIKEEIKTPVPETTSSSASTQTQPQTGEVDTSNWKTYRNEKYGFEVRYPLSFWLDVTTTGLSNSLGQVEKQKIFQLNSNLTSPGLPQDDNLAIYLTPYNNNYPDRKTNLEEQRAKLMSYSVGYGFYASDSVSDTESTVIGIADTKALKNFVYYHLNVKPDSGTGYHIEISLFNKVGDKVILRSLLKNHNRYDAQREERTAIFEKIISTFKFIE